jgi:oxalate decarboxylase/phosphoglucose isomerase-like protein (cupin superfamily)
MAVSLIRKAAKLQLVHEYGLAGKRMLPWDGMNAPFGSAYCVVAPGTSSLEHVNMPADEDELFVCIAGKARVLVGEVSYEAAQGDQIFIPRGFRHFVDNRSHEPFVFFTVWWNGEGAKAYLAAEADGSVDRGMT